MSRMILISFLLFSLISCGGQALLNKSMMIERGYEKQKVLELLGTPGDRQFNGEDEAWQYCRTGMSTDQFVVVWFFQGYVTDVTTYRLGANAGYIGDCSQGFKTVRWEDAPDRIIELRHR